MNKRLFLIGLSTALMLHGAEKFKITKQDASSQLYELSDISNLSFNNPGLSKLKIRKPDGSAQLIAMNEISNITFSGSSIEQTEFFKKKGIGLLTNYPNPFNPTTAVRFATTANGLAKVEIFNQAGQLVTTLHNGKLNIGTHTMQWNAQNASAGTYFVRVCQNGETVSNKMLLLK